MLERWFWIDVKYACFGIASKGDTVFCAAPIANWMIGKTLKQIKPWLLSKHAKVIELKN